MLRAGALLKIFQSGDWLNESRIRVWSAAVLIGSVAMILYFVATASGYSDFRGRPLGTDFSSLYAGGQWVLEGRAAAPFDPELQHEMEKRVLGAATPFYVWYSPPVYLLIGALLALMPYGVALPAWQAATLVAYLLALRGIAADSARGWMLPALAFPGVLMSFTHGHHALLSAALMGGGLFLLERSPLIAGALFGALVYKPEYLPMILLVLAATQRWEAIAGTISMATLLCATSALLFPGAWTGFFGSLEFLRIVVLEQGGIGFFKIQSMFGAARLWGWPVTLAYAAQLAAFASVAVMLAIVWRSRTSFESRAAALIAGTMLSAPYLLDFDLALMAPAIAYLALAGLRQGFLRYEKMLLVFIWFAPLLTRALAENLSVPLGLIAVILLFGLAIRRSADDLAKNSR